MSSKRDYYEILGIAREASADEIKKSYRSLARKHHPDVNRHDESAEEKFKEINEAYSVLSDPEKRRTYDQFGHEGMSGQRGGPGGYGGFGDAGGFGDIFDIFFGGGGRTGRRSVGEDGDDLRYDVDVSLEEASTGVERVLRISRMRTCEKCQGSGAKEGSAPQTCPQCQGTGQVRRSQQTILGSFSTAIPCNMCHGYGYIISDPCDACGGAGRTRATTENNVQIPAGVESGMRIRLRGEGDAGAHGGAPGDLYVVIRVKPHKQFERHGDDIICEIPIDYVQAVLGDTMEVPGLHEKESLQIPAGTQTGTSFRIKGKGIPNINSGALGDEHVVVRIVTPTKLNDEQKKLLLEFGKSRGVDTTPVEGKNFFEKLLGK